MLASPPWGTAMLQGGWVSATTPTTTTAASQPSSTTTAVDSSSDSLNDGLGQLTGDEIDVVKWLRIKRNGADYHNYADITKRKIRKGIYHILLTGGFSESNYHAILKDASDSALDRFGPVASVVDGGADTLIYLSRSAKTWKLRQAKSVVTEVIKKLCLSMTK